MESSIPMMSEAPSLSLAGGRIHKQPPYALIRIIYQNLPAAVMGICQQIHITIVNFCVYKGSKKSSTAVSFATSDVLMAYC